MRRMPSERRRDGPVVKGRLLRAKDNGGGRSRGKALRRRYVLGQFQVPFARAHRHEHYDNALSRFLFLHS
jgi:hypothetical protein